MIVIKKSETADSRTCDFSKVTKEQLKQSSIQHIGDVGEGMAFFMDKLHTAAISHDKDKLADIDQFHADFITNFQQTLWWDKHRKITRHHLTAEDGIPADMDLVDVLEMIVDCVMAGMGRKGEVYPLDIKSEVLKLAFDNTVKLLKRHITV